jgi:hypothetical protein
MSDHHDTIPEWMVEALRRPVVTNGARRARIMELVRVQATRRRFGWRVATRPRKGLATPILGLALAAGLAGIIAAIGDRNVPRRDGARGGGVEHAMIVGDTLGATLHDTLRLVRLVLEAPSASRVALAGDFNGWSRTATPLRATSRAGVWSAVVALPRGRHRYAFVVDDTQWVPAPTLSDRDGARSHSQPRMVTGGDTT